MDTGLMTDKYGEWHFKFDDYGGYDCMFASYDIFCHTKHIATIDYIDHQDLIEYSGDYAEDHENKHSENSRIRKFAEDMVNKLNDH